MPFIIWYKFATMRGRNGETNVESVHLLALYGRSQLQNSIVMSLMQFGSILNNEWHTKAVLPGRWVTRVLCSLTSWYDSKHHLLVILLWPILHTRPTAKITLKPISSFPLTINGHCIVPLIVLLAFLLLIAGYERFHYFYLFFGLQKARNTLFIRTQNDQVLGYNYTLFHRFHSFVLKL